MSLPPPGLLDGACCAAKLEDVPAKFLLSGCFRLNDVSVVHACETAVQRRRSSKPPPNTQPSNHPRCCSPKRRKLGRGIATRTEMRLWKDRERRAGWWFRLGNYPRQWGKY